MEDEVAEPEPTPMPPADEPSDEPLETDLFGPADESEPADEPAINFFGTGDEEPAQEEEVPVEEEEPAAPAEEGEDDIFGGFGAILREPGGLASTEVRRWVDNTDQFSCQARLIRVLDGKVQLLKETGRTTTVPLSRLSQSDLQFVNRQASAEQSESFGRTARVTPQRAAN
jgi:hypothetical protein